MRRRFASLPLILLGVACTGGSDTADTTGGATMQADTAAERSDTSAFGDGSLQVPVRDANGRELGQLTVSESGGGINLIGTLRGLPPGQHAIHLHMVGQCTPPFETAGGHWNPTNMQHGFDNPQGPHHGDMRNIEVAADSSANVNVTTPGGMLRGDANMLLDADGASIIVHAGPDDYRTDPSGNSGARIACGQIVAAN